MQSDDHDMKIAGEHPFSGFDKDADNQLIEKIFEQERKNGNLERARQLGAILASEVFSYYPPDISLQSELVINQARILYCFAVNVTLEKHTKNSIIAKKALSAFNETLKAEAPNFYSSMEQPDAFSFYYLEYRGKPEAQKGIGKVFAMLCSMQGNEFFELKGEQLYNTFCESIKKQIYKIKFV